MDKIFSFLDQKEILLFLISAYIIYVFAAIILLKRDIEKPRTYGKLMNELENGRKMTFMDILMNSLLIFLTCLGILTTFFLLEKKINNYLFMLLYSIISLCPLFIYGIFLFIRIIVTKIKKAQKTI